MPHLADEATAVASENVVVAVCCSSYTPASSIKAKQPPARTAHERKQKANQGRVRNQYHQVMPMPKQYNKLVPIADGEDDDDDVVDDDMPPILLVSATSTVKGNKSNPVKRAVSG